MWNIGPTQLLLVLLIILVLFGGKKLPELAHSLGKSLNEFKRGKDEGDKAAKDSVKEVVNEIQQAQEPKKVEAAAAPKAAEAAKPEEKTAAK